MNREIKFRAWNGQRMTDDADAKRILYNLVTGSTITPKYPIMQFTGLHDKNGKEIYEGDVVKAYNQKPFIKAIKKQVVYKQASFVFEQHDLDFETRTLACSDCKVIGNIYQNPELLQP